MEHLNVCLSQLKAVKDGHVSKTKVSAVCEAALRALRHGKTAGEVADALILHAVSSSKEQRLAALYAIHETVWSEKRKLEEKNNQHRTETRGALSIALEQRILEVFVLFRSTSEKDRAQISKILNKWSDRFVFPAELCRKCAIACDCPVPLEPATTSPRKETAAPPLVQPSSASGPPQTILTTGTLQPISLQIKPLIAGPIKPLTEVAPQTLPQSQPKASEPVKPSSGSQNHGRSGGWGRFTRGGGGGDAPSSSRDDSSKRSRWDA